MTNNLALYKQTGDPRYLDNLYTQYRPMLRRMTRRRGRDTKGRANLKFVEAVQTFPGEGDRRLRGYVKKSVGRTLARNSVPEPVSLDLLQEVGSPVLKVLTYRRDPSLDILKSLMLYLLNDALSHQEAQAVRLFCGIDEGAALSDVREWGERVIQKPYTDRTRRAAVARYMGVPPRKMTQTLDRAFRKLRRHPQFLDVCHQLCEEL